MQKRIKNGLDKVQASIVDIDQSSLFDIFIPKQLRLGKNEIKIRLVNDNTLLKGSEVLIDVLDQNGNPLYYEISNIANEDKTRSIIVSVFEEDQTGTGKLFIYGKLSSFSDYLCKINLEVNPRLETEQEIKFDTPPEIFYQEKKVAVQNFSSQTRVLYKSGSDFTTISPVIPKQLQPSVFDVERKELKPQVSNGTVVNGIASSSLVELPEYSNLGILSSNSFVFSSSFKGGQVWVRNLNLEIPNDALTTTPFLNQTYSASIVEVVSTSSVQVYPPFNLKVEYQSRTGIKTKVYDKFINEGNVTCSYFDVLTLSQGSYTQSYAVFDIFDLEPKSGKVDSIDLSFKNLSLVGDNYEPLGNFKIRSENILIDKNNQSFDPEKGIIEKPIGEFVSGFESYWQTSSLPTLQSNNEVPNGIRLRNKQILELKPSYSPKVSKNSEWVLSFDYYSEPSQSLEPQLDIYISGSEVKNLNNEKLILYTPSQSQQLGTYIGSVTNNRGKTELHFEVKQKSKITPKIRPTNGLWSIGNIKLRPNEKNGFTAKQTRIFAPLTIPTGSELNFKIEYVNPIGQKTTNFSSLLPGVYFEGSRGIISSGGPITIPPGTVSGSDQLTGSYDTRYERKGTGIFSSSQQFGPTGIYSGSGTVRHNTIVSSSNLTIVTDNTDGFKSGIYFERGYSDVTNDLIDNSGSMVIINGSSPSEKRVYWEINDEQKTFKFGNFIPSGWHVEGQLLDGAFYLIAHTESYADNHEFIFGPNGVIFSHGGTNKDGIKYGGDYSASLLTNSRSLPDVGTVRLLFTQSIAYYTSSFDTRYERTGNNIVSSSQQIKNLLPIGVTSGSEQLTSSYDNRYERKGTGIVSSSDQIKNLLPTGVSSGSEQFTSSYDTRYHRLGTGVISSSGQIANDISGSFTQLSGSITSRVYSIEQTTGSLNNFTGSINNRFIGLESKTGSYATTGSNSFNGTQIITGSVYITGSTSPRAIYIWHGPITVPSITPGIVWTDMQNIRNTWLGRGGTMTLDANYIGDFTEMTQGRLYTAMSVAGAGPTCSLEVQYSVDGVSWNSMLYLGIGNSVGNKDSGWTALPSESKQFCYIRLTGYGGDSVTDPRFSPPIALFR